MARHSAGYNNVDIVAAEQLGIWVTNTPDATTNSVAEFTLGMIIVTAKHTFIAKKNYAKRRFFI